MPEIINQITPLPPAPNWGSETPAIAEEKALAFTQALPTLVDELNEAIAEINNRESDVIEISQEALTKALAAETASCAACADACEALQKANEVVSAIGDGVVHLSGDETIDGVKTFTSEPVLPSKSTAAGDNPTKPATEAQVYAAMQSGVPQLVTGSVLLSVKLEAVAPSNPAAITTTGAKIALNGCPTVRLCSLYCGSCHWMGFYCNSVQIYGYGRTGSCGDASVNCQLCVNSGDVFKASGSCMCGCHKLGIALYVDNANKYLAFNSLL